MCNVTQHGHILRLQITLLTCLSLLAQLCSTVTVLIMHTMLLVRYCQTETVVFNQDVLLFLHCFDTVGLVTGRAPSLLKPCTATRKSKGSLEDLWGLGINRPEVLIVLVKTFLLMKFDDSMLTIDVTVLFCSELLLWWNFKDIIIPMLSLCWLCTQYQH